MRFQGILYRALNPMRAREPLSGEGARLYGGRFNPRGTPALYTSMSVLTAIREANQAGSLQPTTLISLEAELDPIFDAEDPAELAAKGIGHAMLAQGDWRLQMRRSGTSAGQDFVLRLIAEGYHGMRVRSFAKGAGSADLNMVLWKWGPRPPVRVSLIDDDGRLA